jgi:ribosome biogenesis GTPase A
METHPSPPYEIEALREIHNRSFDANVLLEIRDVRVPASSHHPSFTRLAKHRLHLVCYTHADMIDPPTRDKVEAWTSKSWPGSRSIFVDTREHRSDLPYDLVYDSLMGYLESRGGINAALTVGVPNTGKSSVLMALLRLARTRGDITKQLKATVSYKKKRRLGKTAPIAILDKPGKTREITEYLLRESPRAFFLDVPGITPPQFFFQERPEAWYAYGAANLMPMSRTLATNLQAQTAFCDYVLHCLNRDGNFLYIPKLGLDGPTEDIEEVLAKVKSGMRDKYADSNPEKLQFKRCESFLKLFNTGNFGPVILDDISKPYRKFEFRDSHFVKKTNYGGYSKRDGFDDDDEHDGRRGRRQGREYDDDTKDEFHEDDFDF